MSSYDKNPSLYLKQSVAQGSYRALEWPVFLDTIGDVAGARILDVACGDGRLSRILAHAGASEVIGVDVSSEMIARASSANAPGAGDAFPDRIRYRVANAVDGDFTLDEPADLVTAMYLFHYAADPGELFAMARFIGRSLKAGGRFVTYTINPDYDFTDAPADMETRIGFRYRIVDPPAYALVIGDFEVPIWQWSKVLHEEALATAGLTDVAWHRLRLPATHADLAAELSWYIDNPSCIVLSARKA